MICINLVNLTVWRIRMERLYNNIRWMTRGELDSFHEEIPWRYRDWSININNMKISFPHVERLWILYAPYKFKEYETYFQVDKTSSWHLYHERDSHLPCPSMNAIYTLRLENYQYHHLLYPISLCIFLLHMSTWRLWIATMTSSSEYNLSNVLYDISIFNWLHLTLSNNSAISKNF